MNHKDILENHNPTKTRSWKKLNDHYQNSKNKTLKDHFAEDNNRVNRFSLEVDKMYLDYSKNLIDKTTMELLYDLAEEVNLVDGIEKMFSGAFINKTENRAVLHTALRAPEGATIEVDGENVVPQVHRVLTKMKTFVSQFDQGSWKGFSGKEITDFVNIGIGGSDLGPVMVCEALRPFHHPNRRVHFVSNIDGAHLTKTLDGLDPETTLFIIASKTFTTIETMTNARSARDWFLKAGNQQDVSKHFIALSTNTEKAVEFGIDLENIFEFWDWVGGRYSLSSAIGMSIMIAIGASHFEELLAGMHAMDTHFRNTSPNQNMPVILALLGIWYTNFFGSETEAVLPYDQDLHYLAMYLQQASMESNGKSVDRDGQQVTYDTGTIIWGEAGTNSQHSFFQLLHQGTRLIPCDFLLPVNPNHDLKHHHNLLAANAFAQCEALMNGKSEDEVKSELQGQGLSTAEIEELAPYKVFEGNHPTNMILLKQLTPYTLGSLIALYEHKIFVQGYIWNIFSFDQFGVELGKALAKKLEPEITGESKPENHDASTNALVSRFKEWKKY